MNQVKTFFQQYLSGYKPYKTYWNYEDGCVLKGCIDLYKATGDAQYSYVFKGWEGYTDGMTVSIYDFEFDYVK